MSVRDDVDISRHTQHLGVLLHREQPGQAVYLPDYPCVEKAFAVVVVVADRVKNLRSVE